jgi:ribosomal protein S18 acetylase RimI-like enzyme
MLARAFFDDPLSVFMLPDAAERARRLPWLFERVVRYGLLYGEVEVTPDGAGVAVWLRPGQTRITAWRMLRAGLLSAQRHLGREALVRLTAFSRRIDAVGKDLLPERHWYLWTIGVEPARQRQGIGSAVIRPGLARADAAGLPCALDTVTEADVAFYMTHGFRVTAEFDAAGLRAWKMVRAAGKGTD